MTAMQAHKACMEISAKFGGGLRSVKWTEVFKDENELIESLKGVAVPSTREAPSCTFKGYEYIFSFAERLQEGKDLTEKQIAQAKRLALEIKKANAISEYMKEV